MEAEKKITYLTNKVAQISEKGLFPNAQFTNIS